MAKQIKSIFDKSYIVKAQAEAAGAKEWPQGYPVGVELSHDVATKKFRFVQVAIPKILEIVDHSEGARRLIDAFMAVASYKIAAAKDPRACSCCPECGSDELYRGTGENPSLNEDHVGGCYQCDWEYDLKEQAKADKIANASMGPRAAQPRLSSIEKPVKRVWHIADSMPMASRKEVMAECVRQGVAYGTARTQYQAWFKASQEAKREDIRKPFQQGE